MTSIVPKDAAGDTPKLDYVLAPRATESDPSESNKQSKDNPEENNLLDALREHPVAFAWSIYAIFVMVASAYTNSISDSVLGIPECGKISEPGSRVTMPSRIMQAAYHGATNPA